MSRQALAAYGRRRLALRKLGFGSYEDYLKSPLWGEIRARVLKRDNATCCGCGSQAKAQVHHSSYEARVLRGQADHRLATVCEDCHQEIEFFAGTKVGPGEAEKRLKELRQRNGLEER